MKTHRSWGTRKALAALCLASCAGSASAVTVTLTPSSNTVNVGDTFTVAIAVTPDGSTTNFQFRLDYNTQIVNATQSLGVAGLPSSCPTTAGAGNINDNLNATTGRVSVNTNSATGTAITFSGTYCTITFVATAAGTLSLNPSNFQSFDTVGSNNVGNASVVINTVSVRPTLSFNPAANGTVNFTGGANVGDTANGTVAVTANSPVGANANATVSNCSITDPNNAFGDTAPADLSLAAGANGNLAMTCVRQSVARTGTLTCSRTDGSGTANVSWTLSCPLGTVVPVNPTITGSNPAANGVVNIAGGTAGSSSQGSIVFSASGGAGTGSTAINCTSNNAAVTVGPNPLNVVGAATSATLTVQVALTDTAQSFDNVINCTGGITATYDVAAPAGIVFVEPEFIPASSLWSQLSLIALFSVLGGVFLALRRNA